MRSKNFKKKIAVVISSVALIVAFAIPTFAGNVEEHKDSNEPIVAEQGEDDVDTIEEPAPAEEPSDEIVAEDVSSDDELIEEDEITQDEEEPEDVVIEDSSRELKDKDVTTAPSKEIGDQNVDSDFNDVTFEDNEEEEIEEDNLENETAE